MDEFVTELEKLRRDHATEFDGVPMEYSPALCVRIVDYVRGEQRRGDATGAAARKGCPGLRWDCGAAIFHPLAQRMVRPRPYARGAYVTIAESALIAQLSTVRVYAMASSVDMRKGFEGLYALATQQMGREVLRGDLFLFVGQTRKRAKVLYFDGTGLCLLHKRLSKGLFAALWRDSQTPHLELSQTELQLFLEGSEAIGRMPLSPAPLGDDDLRRFSSKSRLK